MTLMMVGKLDHGRHLFAPGRQWLPFEWLASQLASKLAAGRQYNSIVPSNQNKFIREEMLEFNRQVFVSAGCSQIVLSIRTD